MDDSMALCDGGMVSSIAQSESSEPDGRYMWSFRVITAIVTFQWPITSKAEQGVQKYPHGY